MNLHCPWHTASKQIIVLKLLFQGKKYSMTTVFIIGGKQLKADYCSQLLFTCGGFSAVTSLTGFPSLFFFLNMTKVFHQAHFLYFLTALD